MFQLIWTQPPRRHEFSTRGYILDDHLRASLLNVNSFNFHLFYTFVFDFKSSRYRFHRPNISNYNLISDLSIVQFTSSNSSPFPHFTPRQFNVLNFIIHPSHFELIVHRSYSLHRLNPIFPPQYFSHLSQLFRTAKSLFPIIHTHAA